MGVIWKVSQVIIGAESIQLLVLEQYLAGSGKLTMRLKTNSESQRLDTDFFLFSMVECSLTFKSLLFKTVLELGESVCVSCIVLYVYSILRHYIDENIC